MINRVTEQHNINKGSCNSGNCRYTMEDRDNKINTN